MGKGKIFPIKLRLIPRSFLSNARFRLFAALSKFHFRDKRHLDSHGVQHLENGFETRLAVCLMARRNSAGSSDSLTIFKYSATISSLSRYSAISKTVVSFFSSSIPRQIALAFSISRSCVDLSPPIRRITIESPFLAKYSL